MGDIREFWIAVFIYVLCAGAIFAFIATTPEIGLSPLLRIVAVLGGGIVLSALVFFVWAGVVRLCSKREN